MKVSQLIELQLIQPDHKQAIFNLTDNNREFLRENLPWLDDTATLYDTEKFIEIVTGRYKSGKSAQYAIFYRGSLCGVCGFNTIDSKNNIGSIGYWLGENFTGKGIIFQSVKALLNIGFGQYNLNRIEIYCAVQNSKSRAVAERLGFTLEGVLRQREYLYGEYLDHALYSLLASEQATTQ